MKYKGIELNEFTSDKPVVFDPPKRMLVWDCNDETPTEKDVIAFIPNRYHKAIEQMSVYIHCAEIPDTGSELATNLELAKWLVQGNGQCKTGGSPRLWTEYSYGIGYDEEACPNTIKARKWDDTEWHEPTLEYLGLED